jgi:hypothetical protein
MMGSRWATSLVDQSTQLMGHLKVARLVVPTVDQKVLTLESLAVLTVLPRVDHSVWKWDGQIPGL